MWGCSGYQIDSVNNVMEITKPKAPLSFNIGLLIEMLNLKQLRNLMYNCEKHKTELFATHGKEEGSGISMRFVIYQKFRLTILLSRLREVKDTHFFFIENNKMPAKSFWN